MLKPEESASVVATLVVASAWLSKVIWRVMLTLALANVIRMLLDETLSRAAKLAIRASLASTLL